MGKLKKNKKVAAGAGALNLKAKKLQNTQKKLKNEKKLKKSRKTSSKSKIEDAEILKFKRAKKLQLRRQRQLQIVPWSSSEEWEQICQEFHQDKFQELEEDLTVWRERVTALPIGCDAALYLVQAFINDPEFQKPSTSSVPVSDDALRSLYSIAIIRFMNHVSYTTSAQDQNNDVGSKKIFNTLNENAKRLGIPELIVTLRNEASHGVNLPSLEILRIGAQIILNWLKENYFTVDSIMLNTFASNENEIDLLISSFLACRIYQFRKCDKISDQDILNQLQMDSSSNEDFSNNNIESCTTLDAVKILKAKIESILESNPYSLCKSLVSHTIPLKDDHHLVSSVSNPADGEYEDNPSFYKDFHRILMQRQPKQCSSEDIFKQFYKLWIPIINSLLECGEIVTFIDCLCDNLVNLNYELVLRWVGKIIGQKNQQNLGLQSIQRILKDLLYNTCPGSQGAVQFEDILLPTLSRFLDHDRVHKLKGLLNIQCDFENENEDKDQGESNDEIQVIQQNNKKKSKNVDNTNNNTPLFTLDQIRPSLDTPAESLVNNTVDIITGEIPWFDIPIGSFLNK